MFTRFFKYIINFFIKLFNINKNKEENIIKEEKPETIATDETSGSTTDEPIVITEPEEPSNDENEDGDSTDGEENNENEPQVEIEKDCSQKRIRADRQLPCSGGVVTFSFE